MHISNDNFLRWVYGEIKDRKKRKLTNHIIACPDCLQELRLSCLYSLLLDLFLLENNVQNVKEDILSLVRKIRLVKSCDKRIQDSSSKKESKGWFNVVFLPFKVCPEIAAFEEEVEDIDYEKITTEELAEYLKVYDTKAWEVAFNRYEKLIYYIVEKYFLMKEKEDILQKTFLKLSLNIAELRDNAKLKNYTCTIAHNICRQMLRKQTKINNTIPYDKKEGWEENIDYSLLSNNDNPYQKFLNDEVRTVLTNALDEINPIYKEIVNLYYYEGYSYEVIARNLNIPLKTVGTRLFKAKRQLIQILRKNFPDINELFKEI